MSFESQITGVYLKYEINLQQIYNIIFKLLGQLSEAATKLNDESVLRHIRDKDCVAIEAKYHRSCFKSYCRQM